MSKNYTNWDQFNKNKKIGNPTDVTNLIEFLVSNKSSYINGANINISGGSILD